MSSLTLVRHGQASAFLEDAGRLTPLGETQASRLGAYWLKHGVRFDEVRSGTLARQIQTERLVAECFQEAGEPWPEPVRDCAWNEYDAGAILAAAGPPGRMPGTPEEYRRFQMTFEDSMLRWLKAEAPKGNVESFAAFRDRVSSAIGRVMAGPSGRRVAVFTSGGPIGFTVNLAMRGPDRSFLEVNWRVRNGSVSEFVFTSDRLTLDSFNQISHLEEAALRTYR